MSYGQFGYQAQQNRDKKSKKHSNLRGGLVTIQDPDSVAADAYRTLRTGLLYGLVDAPPKAIMVTSPGPAEGKSTICANLGVVLAQAGKRTLIVDCDLRRPRMHEVFGLLNMRGVVNVLAGEYGPREAYQAPLPNLEELKAMTVGALPPNPAELLGSRRLSEILDEVREEFDFVLLDSSPIGPVPDPAVLSTQTDGVLLALDAQRTSKEDVRLAMRKLRNVGARVLGTVMNNAEAPRGGYQYY